MRVVVPAALVLVAIIHALPILGVLGASKLSQLYGVDVSDPSLELLLRHRAILFGLLAAFLVVASFRPELHWFALAAGFVSVASFLILAQMTDSMTAGVAAVVRADWVALVLLLAGIAAKFFYRE
jgi:drug/metabolite transporter (DMT)-like permease